MLKKFLAAMLLCVLSCWTCFAQTAMPATNGSIESNENEKAVAKFSRADFYKIESPAFDLEKESLKTQTKKNNFSGGAKTALWVALLGAGVVTVVILATRNREENNNNSPCGVIAQVGVPCPPGCVCIAQ